MVGLLVTALAFYVYSPFLTLTAATGGPASSARPQSAPAPSVTTRMPLPTPVASSSAEAPRSDLPPGPGGQLPGIRLVATVLEGGGFAVTETVRLPAPATTLTLAPPDLHRAGRTLHSARPVATQLVVRADGRSVRLPQRTVRRVTTVTLRRPTDHFVIRYELHGTIKRNKPSRAGRALGAVGPLTSGMPDDLPVAASFSGQAVRNLRCSGLPVDQQACVAGHPPHVRVNQDLPYRAALVLLQLDLAEAGR